MGSESSLPLDPFENGWIIEWLTSPTMNYITWCLNILQIGIMPCLFIAYIYKLIKTESWMPFKTGKERKLAFINNAIHVITLICITFSFISGICALLNNTASISYDTSCVPITITLNITWLISKISIYNVTLLRLEAVFWGTVFEYNKKFILAMYCIINIIFIICLIGSFIDIDSILFAEPDSPGWCLYIIPTWLILLPSSLDFVFTPIAVILIATPLRKIISADQGNENIAKILTKYVLLSTIAVFSNLFSSLFFGITDITFFNWMDVIINPLCLVLMQVYNWNIYYSPFCCKYCHNGLHKILHNKQKQKDVKMMVKMAKSDKIGVVIHNPATKIQNKSTTSMEVSTTTTTTTRTAANQSAVTTEQSAPNHDVTATNTESTISTQ